MVVAVKYSMIKLKKKHQSVLVCVAWRLHSVLGHLHLVELFGALVVDGVLVLTVCEGGSCKNGRAVQCKMFYYVYMSHTSNQHSVLLASVSAGKVFFFLFTTQILIKVTYV